MTRLAGWSTHAVNLPEHASNVIHTDAGARAAGFAGALVAGVTTYGYLTHAPAMAWGTDWLESGGATMRFRHPILDGDRVECVVSNDGEGAGAVTATVDGEARAEAAFTRTSVALERGDGPMLEPLRFTLERSWSDYGMRAGEDCGLYDELGIAHPTAWPRIANDFFHEQLVNGPWIHVRSTIQHLGTAPIGSTITATAAVTRRFDSRAGKRAILDVRVSSDGNDVAAVEHEAIIELASS